MFNELSLEAIAQEVAVWRQSKKYRGSPLPDALALHIRALSQYHKKSFLAKSLKIDNSTINKILKLQEHQQPPVISNTKPPKKSYSKPEKLALCRAWNNSGMSLEQFSEVNNVSKSALYRWSRYYKQETESPKQNWLPVKLSGPPMLASEQPILIELSLPNGGVVRVTTLRNDAVMFLQELYHAVATIR